MGTKFSEDVISLSDLKVNPGKVGNHATDSKRPVLLTIRGRGVAVVQGLAEYEKNDEELAFVKAIAQGLMDIEEGKTVSLKDAKKRFGISQVKISFAHSALDDMSDIQANYLKEGVPAIGDECITCFFESVEALKDHPDLGRVVPEFEEQHISEVIDPPFRIVYLRGVIEVQVIRIWRSERLLDLNWVHEAQLKDYKVGAGQ